MDKPKFAILIVVIGVVVWQAWQGLTLCKLGLPGFSFEWNCTAPSTVPSAGYSRADCQNFAEKANESFLAHDWQASIGWLNKVLQCDPGNIPHSRVEDYYHRGYAKCMSRDEAGPRADFLEVLHSDPNNPIAKAVVQGKQGCPL